MNAMLTKFLQTNVHVYILAMSYTKVLTERKKGAVQVSKLSGESYTSKPFSQ